MQGIFIAHGPFAKSMASTIKVINSFSNLEIYSLIVKLLNIQNVPHTNCTLGFWDQYFWWGSDAWCTYPFLGLHRSYLLFWYMLKVFLFCVRIFMMYMWFGGNLLSLLYALRLLVILENVIEWCLLYYSWVVLFFFSFLSYSIWMEKHSTWAWYGMVAASGNHISKHQHMQMMASENILRIVFDNLSCLDVLSWLVE